MPGRIRFVCLLHSHQPVGNFDHVIEEAYRMSYLAYVEVFEQFPKIPLTHHCSGCLLEWLEQKHPEYIERLARNTAPANQSVSRRPWEMVGGGFYEPIMTMLTDRDRIGQIRRMQEYIEKHFGVRPRGLWLPERVWEPGLVKDLADAGVRYLTLDETHFKAAGLEDKDLTGGFVAEDQGRVLTVYPAWEKLRYLIPYGTVKECIQWLHSQLPESGEKVVCYADDGEKFGSWPKTYKHVYQDGWLKNFLAALQHAQDEGWLYCSTLSEAYDEVEAVGQVSLPENSYREMTEWALPARRLAAYENDVRQIKRDPALAHDTRIRDILQLVKGGNWRSFKVKYPESARMYGKMMEVSARAAALPAKSKLREKALTHLYRGQCNCPYWHGVFGGMYLPHLRSAIYTELIKADKLVDEMSEEDGPGSNIAASGAPPSLACQDFDFDGEDEYKLSNEHVALYLHPRRGGHLYEFDLRDINFNVTDTFSRRFEAYHEKVARAVVGDSDETASIHDLVLAKEPGLAQLLKYDNYMRESLVDHLCSTPLTPESLLSGDPPSDPGFRTGHYQAASDFGLKGGRRTRQSAIRNPQSAIAAVNLSRRAPWQGIEIQLSKQIVLAAGAGFEVEYSIENTGGRKLDGHFAVEMNYSLLAGEAHDRYYYHEKMDNAGKLATTADFGQLAFVGLKDHWLNVALTLQPSVPAQVLVSPVKTVSQSEGGFESVYQSSCVVLQWPVSLAPAQVFKVRLRQEIGRASG